MRSISASVICTTVSALRPPRRPARFEPAAPPAPLSLSDRTRSSRAAARAGARPKSTVATSEASSANNSTRPSRRTSASRGTPAGAIRGSRRIIQAAQKQPGASAEQRQHDALGQELPDDADAAGAEGGADGHLALPCRRAGQQQVGDVRAGYQQHEADGGPQHEQRRTYGPVLPLLQRHEAQREALTRCAPAPSGPPLRPRTPACPGPPLALGPPAVSSRSRPSRGRRCPPPRAPSAGPRVARSGTSFTPGPSSSRRVPGPPGSRPIPGGWLLLPLGARDDRVSLQRGLHDRGARFQAREETARRRSAACSGCARAA